MFRSVFGRLVAEGYWEWKLRSLPTQAENEWVAVADGKIVGHYAVTPVRFKVCDREFLIPHGCDAMTHPGYRRQGILSALGRRANEVWGRAGAPFQIGFHYGGWGSVRERLGWQPVARLLWVKRWIRPFASLAQRFRLPGTRIWTRADSLFNRIRVPKEQDSDFGSAAGRFRLERVRRAGGQFDRLWERLSSAYGILAIRDRAWVQWRYLDMPGVEQQLILASREDQPLGYIVFRIAQEAGMVRAAIVDCFVAPEDTVTLRALVSHAVDEVSGRGARSLAALVMPDSPLCGQFLQAAFWKGRHGFDFSVIPYSSTISDLIAGGWFVTGAEGDVI